MNIASHLQRMAELQPHRLAVVFPQGRDRTCRVAYTHYTFRQLHEESDRLAAGFERLGIRRGTRVVLMVKPSLDFFALTFALFKAGAVPVMIDPGMGIANLGTCIAEAQPEVFIGISKAHAARVALGWGKSTVRILVTVGKRWFWGGVDLDHVRRLGDARPAAFPREKEEGTGDETAAILFTSGSTGIAKGAVYTHAIFASQVEMLRETYGIEPGEIDLPTFPLFALFAPALGMTAIIPDMDPTRPALVDPLKIIEAVENFGVTNMFGSPALLNRVGRYGEEHGVKLASLRRVISAGAPVRAEVLERFGKLLTAGARIHTPYGATEALPVCSITDAEILAATRSNASAGGGVCVGRPVPPMQLAIIAITDTPLPNWTQDLVLPTGEIGEIAVKGPIVTREYYNRPEATALAKIADLEHGGFYHRMGDVGYLDEMGRVWFCGRKSQRVETASKTLFTIPCEAVFNEHPSVSRSALVGVSRKGATKPVICVELENEKSANCDQNRIRRELLELGRSWKQTRSIETILFHPKFPVDIRHNAKISRERLAKWAARKLR